MSLSVSADIPEDTDLLGKVVTDLQEDVTVGNDAISGTLHYVTGYTGFSGDASEQAGNYLALHFEAEDATFIAVKVVGSEHDPVTLDEDGLLVLRIREVAKGINVYTVADGVTYMNRFEFVNLICEPKADD